LLLTCAVIRLKILSFFNYDSGNREEQGLLADFLALVEQKSVSSRAGEIYRIDRAPGFSDDFAQAVNMGCVAIWHTTRHWPNLAIGEKWELSEDQMDVLSPDEPDWEGADDVVSPVS
jgi:hypothetical protein